MPDSSSLPNVVCFVVDQMRHDHLGCGGPTSASASDRDVGFIAYRADRRSARVSPR